MVEFNMLHRSSDLPRSASWIEEMEKRSRRRIRDLVALAAFQGLSQNEIGCARISMMARSTNAPFKGRIQKRKTNHLQIFTFGLQRTAGPYTKTEIVPTQTLPGLQNGDGNRPLSRSAPHWGRASALAQFACHVSRRSADAAISQASSLG